MHGTFRDGQVAFVGRVGGVLAGAGSFPIFRPFGLRGGIGVVLGFLLDFLAVVIGSAFQRCLEVGFVAVAPGPGVGGGDARRGLGGGVLVGPPARRQSGG